MRRGERGQIAVTNDYRVLNVASQRGVDSLRTTSDARYDTTCVRVASEAPADSEACLRILSDKRVRMDITVQQAVMSAANGTLVATAVFR